MLLLLGPFDVVLQQPVVIVFRQHLGAGFHRSDRRHPSVFVLPRQGSEAFEIGTVILLDAVEQRREKKDTERVHVEYGS